MTKTLYKDRILKQLEAYVPTKDAVNPETDEGKAAMWLAGIELAGLQKALAVYIGEGAELTAAQAKLWLAKTSEEIVQDTRNLAGVVRQYKHRRDYTDASLVDQERDTYLNCWKLQDDARREDPARYEAGMRKLAELRAKKGRG